MYLTKEILLKKIFYFLFPLKLGQFIVYKWQAKTVVLVDILKDNNTCSYLKMS